jgi:hypothetical protein
MAKFQRRRSGDKLTISASDWNAMVETAEAYHAGKLSSTTKVTKSQLSSTIKRVNSVPVSNVFSVTGLVGPGSVSLPKLVNDFLLVHGSFGGSSGSAVGVTQNEVVATGGISAVVDGLTPVRIKLGIDPESGIIRRASPVGGEVFLRGDQLGVYEVIWHSTKVYDSPETDAAKGDIVWGLVRLGLPELPWVHVTPTMTSGKCVKNGEGYFPASYSMDSVTGSYSGDCWLTFRQSADIDMPIWGDHTLTGYLARWVEVGSGESAEERPEIIVAEHPIKSIFGEWTATEGTSDTSGSIAVRRGATDLLDYSASAESPFGAIANGKLVKADCYPGYGFMAVATEC